MARQYATVQSVQQNQRVCWWTGMGRKERKKKVRKKKVRKKKEEGMFFFKKKN